MDDRYIESQKIYDETKKFKCLDKKCVYNINNTCRRIDILIKTSSDKCNCYETSDVIR